MATARMLRFRKGFAVFWVDVVGVVSYAVVAVDSAMLRHDEGRPGSCPSRYSRAEKRVSGLGDGAPQVPVLNEIWQDKTRCMECFLECTVADG